MDGKSRDRAAAIQRLKKRSSIRRQLSDKSACKNRWSVFDHPPLSADNSKKAISFLILATRARRVREDRKNRKKTVLLVVSFSLTLSLYFAHIFHPHSELYTFHIYFFFAQLFYPITVYVYIFCFSFALLRWCAPGMRRYEWYNKINSSIEGDTPVALKVALRCTYYPPFSERGCDGARKIFCLTIIDIL